MRSKRYCKDEQERMTTKATSAGRRMLKYLEDSESTKVGIRELEEQVLFPYDSGSDMVHIARRVKNERSQNLFQIFRQAEDEIIKDSKARWDAQLRGLVELVRLCQSLRVKVEHQCERQEVLKDLVVSKKDMQRTAPEDCQRKNTRNCWS